MVLASIAAAAISLSNAKARSRTLGSTVRSSSLAPVACAECTPIFGWDRRSCWSAGWVVRSVNPLRELRRFESFTCHQVFEASLPAVMPVRLLHRLRWETAHPARGSHAEVVLGAWACGGHDAGSGVAIGRWSIGESVNVGHLQPHGFTGCVFLPRAGLGHGVVLSGVGLAPAGADDRPRGALSRAQDVRGEVLVWSCR